MKNKKRDGIESFLLKTNGLIKQDEKGHYYIPICNFPHHIGVIRNEQTCLNRDCGEYARHYLLHQKENYRIYPDNIQRDLDNKCISEDIE